ncbi:MAG TPA: M23 family metallopeptidase [Dehalococcoidia bacterium]|nr:M23 family metallopeptidase [Dehalococcoidia bacterium]
MSVAPAEHGETVRLLVPAAPRESDPRRWQERAARRRRGRLVLATIAIAAMLGAGLLLSPRLSRRRLTLVQSPDAAAPAPLSAASDADPESVPAGPPPVDAPRQIVQALAGHAANAAGAAGAPGPAAGPAPAAAADASTEAASDAAATNAEPAPSGVGGPAAGDAAAVPAAPPAAISAAPTAAADGRSYLNTTAPPAVASSAGAVIVWPARGPITSLFGPAHPLGIDIGIPQGTIVQAMADGRIAFAGGNACCSYGYYVDIDHGDGIITRYGHLLYVPALAVGQPIHAGDPIGLSGTTGNSTGPHLHFEVRLNGFPVNPLLVLPGGR